MKSIITCMLMCFMGLSAQGVEVYCGLEGCMNGGWKVYSNGRLVEEAVCNYGDCAYNGWRGYNYVGGRHLQIRCAGDDCFNNGWIEETVQGHFVRSISCNRDPSEDLSYQSSFRDLHRFHPPRCLEWGWQIEDYLRQTIQVECVENDCSSNGWWIHRNNRTDQVRCRFGDCFMEGWYLWY